MLSNYFVKYVDWMTDEFCHDYKKIDSIMYETIHGHYLIKKCNLKHQAESFISIKKI